MSPTEATAEVFLTAFRALSKKQRQAVLARLAVEPEDLHDLALVTQRRDEPSRPLRSLTSVVPGL